MIWALLIVPWFAVWWRFRGGALTALTGFNPGTGGMRAIAAVAMAVPVGLLSHWWFLLAPLLWLAWSTAGWGAFQGMGHEHTVEEKNELAHLLSLLTSSMVRIDLAGMAIEGFWVMCFALVPGWIVYWHTEHIWQVSVMCTTGLLFSPIYYVWQTRPRVPNFGHFASGGSEWAEVTVGALVGIVVALVALY